MYDGSLAFDLLSPTEARLTNSHLLDFFLFFILPRRRRRAQSVKSIHHAELTLQALTTAGCIVMKVSVDIVSAQTDSC